MNLARNLHVLLAPWRYVPAAVLLLVLAGPAGAWGQRGLKNIPDPDPQLQQQTFVVADGFEVNLYAADPQIAKPIQMDFDARGRLWIASSEVYPHIKPGQQADDKILVLQDTTGDGRADKTDVFADGLLIPTGVAPGDGGVYVANSTELIHLQDTTGDGRADRRRVVLSGFGTEDTHHLLHTLRWGPDGALYMNQSIYIHSHVETPYGVRRLNGGGIWQFRPETLQLEVFCRGLVNPWGHHFDRWGQSFATDGAGGEGINYVFPGSVFVTAPGATRRVEGLNPGSPKYCGLEILSGRHLPPQWQGQMITNDFRAHRVCRFAVSEDGSGYASRQQPELIKSTHVAFRPVDVKMGPDGAIYIADWYNPIIQHGEVDFRDPRRDQVRGRIWRITAKDRPLVEPPPLVDAGIEELLEALKLPEDWIRLHAKLILKGRGAEQVSGPLGQWLAQLDPQDPHYDQHRLEALWTYQCLDQPDQRLLGELLASDDHRVRAAALRVASAWHQRLEQPLGALQAGVRDEHPRVRLEAVRALARVPQAEAVQWALEALDQPQDRFLDFALWQTVRDLQPHWLPALQQGRLDFGGNLEHLTFALQAIDSPGVVEPLLNLIRRDQLAAGRMQSVVALIAGLGNPDELGQVLDVILSDRGQVEPDRRAELLESLVEGSRRRKLRPSGDLERLKELFRADSNRLRAAAARATGAWQVGAGRAQLLAWASSDERTCARLRRAAIEALGWLGSPEDAAKLAQLATSYRSLKHRTWAVTALAPLDAKRAAEQSAALLAGWPADQDPAPVVAALLEQRQGPEALAAALEGKTLTSDVAKLALRAVRASAQPSPLLIAAVQQAGHLEAGGWKLDEEQTRQLIAEVHSQGDPARGEAVYRRAELQCTKCHAIGGAGGQVGPDMASLGASAQVDYLLESLLLPDAKVKENFHSLVVLTDEGRVVTGIPVRETATELVLRDAEDREVTLAAHAIEEKRPGRSLMPDGLVDELTRAELVDLVRFLSELGKVGDYAVSNARLARRWQALVWTPETHRKLNRSSYDAAANDDGQLTWEPAYSLVSGSLPLEGLPEFVVQRGNDPTSFIRCELEVTTPGQVRLLLNSTAGLTLWLNGQPVTPQSELLLELPSGRHHLTLAINRNGRQQPVRLELDDVPGSPAQAQLVGGK